MIERLNKTVSDCSPEDFKVFPQARNQEDEGTFYFSAPLIQEVKENSKGLRKEGSLLDKVPDRFSVTLEASDPTLNAIIQQMPDDFCYFTGSGNGKLFAFPKTEAGKNVYGHLKNPETHASVFSPQDLILNNVPSEFKTLDLQDPKVKKQNVKHLWAKTRLLLSPEEAKAFRYYFEATGEDADKIQIYPETKDERGWAEYVVYRDLILNDDSFSHLDALKSALREKIESGNDHEKIRAFVLFSELVNVWQNKLLQEDSDAKVKKTFLSIQNLPDEALGNNPSQISAARERLDEIKSNLLLQGLMRSSEADLRSYIDGSDVGEIFSGEREAFRLNVDEIAVFLWLEEKSVDEPSEYTTWLPINRPLLATADADSQLEWLLPTQRESEQFGLYPSLFHLIESKPQRADQNPIAKNKEFGLRIKRDAKFTFYINFFKKLAEAQRNDEEVSASKRSAQISQICYHLQQRVRADSSRWHFHSYSVQGVGWNLGGQLLTAAVGAVLGLGVIQYLKGKIPFFVKGKGGVDEAPISPIEDLNIKKEAPTGSDKPNSAEPKGEKVEAPKTDSENLRIGLRPEAFRLSFLDQVALKTVGTKTVYQFASEAAASADNSTWIYASYPLLYGIRTYGAKVVQALPRVLQAVPNPIVKLGTIAAAGAITYLSASDANANDSEVEKDRLIAQELPIYELVLASENPELPTLSQNPKVQSFVQETQTLYQGASDFLTSAMGNFLKK